MSLAIFDLDNTLLSDDSDYLWGQFLAAQGLVDGEAYEQENLKFYEDYKKGGLDIYAFLSFSLKPLSKIAMDELTRLHEKFMQEYIIPVIAQGTPALLDKHRSRGDTLMIITATNRFITAPIAAHLGVPHLLATDPEIKDGRYTGQVTGTPCFQDGKVTRLDDWLKSQDEDLTDSWFYSDSHNDLPLLRKVNHPVAVDPDNALQQVAAQQGWPIISLRD